MLSRINGFPSTVRLRAGLAVVCTVQIGCLRILTASLQRFLIFVTRRSASYCCTRARPSTRSLTVVESSFKVSSSLVIEQDRGKVAKVRDLARSKSLHIQYIVIVSFTHHSRYSAQQIQEYILTAPTPCSKVLSTPASSQPPTLIKTARCKAAMPGAEQPGRNALGPQCRSGCATASRRLRTGPASAPQ